MLIFIANHTVHESFWVIGAAGRCIMCNRMGEMGC